MPAPSTPRPPANCSRPDPSPLRGPGRPRGPQPASSPSLQLNPPNPHNLCPHPNLKVSLSGAAPPPRQGHLLTVQDQTLYLFGGLDDLGAPSLRLFKLPVPRAALAAAADAAANSIVGGTSGGGGSGGSMGGGGAGAAGGHFNGEWEEVESELTYNRSRSVVMYRGSLNIYQLGSSTLGKPNDDDAEKGGVGR